MTEVKRKQCNVFPHNCDASTAEVVIRWNGQTWKSPPDYDLSQRAFERLLSFVHRGLSVPSKPHDVLIRQGAPPDADTQKE